MDKPITSPPERVPRPRSHLFTVRVWEGLEVLAVQ
jgi:hypothetical protein